MLEIFTFGGLEIIENNRQIAGIAMRKSEALLVYLVYNQHSFFREVLAELLWDNREYKRAMSNLRTVLSNSRKVFGKYLTFPPHSVNINPEAEIKLDAIRLESILVPIIQLGGSVTDDNAQQFGNIVELYRGDFLQGFHVRGASGFEKWCVMIRENLREMVLEALSKLVEFQIKGENYSIGIQQARHLLQIDPLRETAQQQLMYMLACTGQRGAALKQYEICRHLLHKELNVKPVIEMTNLYYDILQGRVTGP
jgi:DNA-binding SARP family transcriptional activator